MKNAARVATTVLATLGFGSLVAIVVGYLPYAIITTIV